jgi:hypothetical protein
MPLNNVQLRLPEVVVPDQRLGRNINHDLRSGAYLVPETSDPATVRWERRVGPFDQGNLGSCTIQALLGLLATDPFWDTLPKEMQTALGRQDVQTALAQPLYREETRLDPFAGAWEPDDTGSDGLSSAKTGRNHGWISGYQHATSVAAAHNAIKTGPFMSGLLWMNGMDNPTSEGVVHATGYVRGGHEWEFAGYNASTGLWECWQSWGDWAKGGVFYLPDEDYDALLAQQGDATALVPTSKPAPTPTPTPVPAGHSVDFTDDQFTALADWATSPHGWRKATAAAKAWAAATR